MRSGDNEAALKFVRKLRLQCRRLAELPGQIGQSRPELRDDIRSFAFGNYVIFFRYEKQTLDIVSIVEGHRDIDALFDDRR